jgi:hypothetical protein
MIDRLPHTKALMTEALLHRNALFTFYTEQKIYFCFLEYDAV